MPEKSEEILQESFMPSVEDSLDLAAEAPAEKRRVTEEIVFTPGKDTKKNKKSAAKKEKQQKPPKEKKIKEPIKVRQKPTT